MLFLWGGLNEDHTFYEEAWELSKGTFYHAQNGLAKYYMAKEKDHQKAIECYKKSLEINFYQIK